MLKSFVNVIVNLNGSKKSRVQFVKTKVLTNVVSVLAKPDLSVKIVNAIQVTLTGYKMIVNALEIKMIPNHAQAMAIVSVINAFVILLEVKANTMASFVNAKTTVVHFLKVKFVAGKLEENVNVEDVNVINTLKDQVVSVHFLKKYVLTLTHCWSVIKTESVIAANVNVRNYTLDAIVITVQRVLINVLLLVSQLDNKLMKTLKLFLSTIILLLI